MKNFKKAYILVIFCMTFVLMNCSTDETQTVTTLNNLVWQDEFNSDGAPNPTNWNYDVGDGSEQGIPGWGNGELQYYTDRPENIVIEDGMLKITARQESFEGYGYTSARINTKGKFNQKYGRFEARMKFPWGTGFWPAFWMLGANIDDVNWPNCGEIDIVEFGGSEPTIVSGAIHGPGYSGGEAVFKRYDLVNDRFDTGFHIFGIEWGPDYINYYVDDALYHQVTPEDVDGDWVFNDNPFYVILNLAIGGSFEAPPTENTEFPQALYVDYVRVYQ